MPRISEKVEFMKTMAVEVCTTGEIVRSPEAENICFCLNSRKNRLGRGNP